MEPYRNKMGNPYSQSMNSGCNQGRPPINQTGNRNRQMNMQMNVSEPCCPRPTVVHEEMGMNCNCKDTNPHMRHFMPGMAYVPMQEWGELYDLEDAHRQGTIFPELNYIFCGARGKM